MRITLLLSLLPTLMSCASAQKHHLQEQELICYEYHEQGMTAQPIADLRVAINHDSTTCIIRLIHDFDYLYYRTDTALLHQIGRVIKQHKMYKYKDRYTPIFEVLDGITWSYTATYHNGQYLQSRGHEVWPKDDGLQLINQLIRDCVRDAQPYKQVSYSYDADKE